MSVRTEAVALEQSQRLQWMDTLRGLAILLVLFWHAPAIPALFDFEIPSALRAVNEFFLPFRMPMLMFLSGLLLPRSLSKPLGSYYIGKFRLVVWPYLIWALLHMLTFEATAPLYHPRAWIATGYLWFIFFIACYYLAAPLLRRVPPYIPPIMAFALAVPAPEGLPTRMLYFAGFFFAGNLAATYSERFHDILGNRVVVFVSAAVAVGFGIFATMVDIQYNALFAPFSLAGILAAIALVRRVGSQRWATPVRYVGRNSIVYYVSHFPIMHFMLLALMAVGVTGVAVAAPLLFAAALLVGTGLAYFKDRPVISWLFSAPWPPGRSGPAASLNAPESRSA
ncbi:MAG: acyltransferase [Mycetocola sp.]